MLGPQRSDGFAGWGVVASVRRDYRTLGHEAAVARVKAALDASPDGPAAPDMRLWLANELTAHGSAAAAAARAAVLEDENALPATKAALRSRERRLAQTARQNLVAAALGVVASAWAVAVVGVRLRREVAREPAEQMSAGAVAGGLLLLAVLPAAMAWTWGASGWPWFLATGSAGVLGARLAPGLPIWLAVPGTIACVGLGAWAANWFTSLGIG